MFGLLYEAKHYINQRAIVRKQDIEYISTYCFKEAIDKYPKNLSKSNYSTPPLKSSKSKNRVSVRGPILWKKIHNKL